MPTSFIMLRDALYEILCTLFNDAVVAIELLAILVLFFFHFKIRRCLVSIFFMEYTFFGIREDDAQNEPLSLRGTSSGGN